MAIAGYRVFKKAGEAGWKSLIPIYNLYIFLKIIHRPSWWIVLYFVPLLNLVISLIAALDLAKAFGRSHFFAIVTLWIVPIIGWAILAFEKNKFIDITEPVQPLTPMQNKIPLPANKQT
jgi:hypothetical protein